MTRLATRASSCEEPHRAIDEVSASHLIDDAAYPSTTLHSSGQVWCPFARYPASRSRSLCNTFSDLRCNVACLFERYVRPIAVILKLYG